MKTTKTFKSGNSVAVRLPKALGVEAGVEMIVREESGRYIYFEGTYSSTFEGKVEPTPRYDYNQMMYRMDLADERLAAARLGK